MKKYNFLLHIFIAVIFILIGFVVSKGAMFVFLIALILTIISFGVFIILGIIDLIRKSNHYRKASFAIIYLVIILVSSMFFFTIEEYHKDKAVEQILNELDSIKEKDGKYPLSLDNISAKSFFPEINYSIDTIYQEFTLWYEVKGWNKKVYYRKDNDWTVKD